MCYPKRNHASPAPGSRGGLTDTDIGRCVEIIYNPLRQPQPYGYVSDHVMQTQFSSLREGDTGTITKVGRFSPTDGYYRIQWNGVNAAVGTTSDHRTLPMYIPQNPAVWKFCSGSEGQNWTDNNSTLVNNEYTEEPTHAVLVSVDNPDLQTKTNVENVVAVGELDDNDHLTKVNETSVTIDKLLTAIKCRVPSTHSAQRRPPAPHVPPTEPPVPYNPPVIEPPEACMPPAIYMPATTPENPNPVAEYVCPTGYHIEWRDVTGDGVDTRCCVEGVEQSFTYDCVNGVCVQKTDGSGSYASLQECAASCSGGGGGGGPSDPPPSDPPDVPCANPSDPGCDAHLNCDFTATPKEYSPSSIVEFGNEDIRITYPNCQVYETVHGCVYLRSGAFSGCDYVVETDKDLSDPLINGHENQYKEGALVFVTGVNQLIEGVYPIKNVHAKGFTVTNRTEGRTPLSGIGADSTIGGGFHVVHLKNNLVNNSLFTDLHDGGYGGPEWDHWTEPTSLPGAVGATTLTDPQGELDYVLRDKAIFATGGWGNTDPHQTTDYNQFAAYQDIDVVSGKAYYLDWLGDGKIFCDTALREYLGRSSQIGIGVDIADYLTNTVGSGASEAQGGPGKFIAVSTGTIRLYISSDLATGSGALGSTATQFERVTLVQCD